MFNFYHIAKNTFVEAIREPVYFLLLTVALLMIGHFPFVTMFVFFDQIKLVVDSAMATTLVFGLFAVVLSASHTLSREMRNGTVLLLLSKPVNRVTFVLAKVFGIIAAGKLFVFICNAGSIASLYMAQHQFHPDLKVYAAFMACLGLSAIIGLIGNFLYQKPFTPIATIGLTIFMPLLALGTYLLCPKPEIGFVSFLYALLLLFLSISTMGAITVVFATRLNTVANLVLSFTVFCAGLLSNYLFGGQFDSKFAATVAEATYRVLPNWQFFWLADALATNQVIPFSYVLWAIFYCFLYIVLCCIWAFALFRTKEIASSLDT